MSDPPDVVIPVRRGDDNEELRYALRSLRLVPHGRVWLAGHAPGWTNGEAGRVPAQQRGTKHENALGNLLAACADDRVSEVFYLWNDDFFLLREVPRVPALHRGTVGEFLGTDGRRLGRTRYVEGMRTTGDILGLLGHLDPLCYELHVPMPVHKQGFLDAAELARTPGLPKTRALQFRSLYGNLAGLGGERMEDVKVYGAGKGWEPGPSPFVSTSDTVWRTHSAAAHVRALHPDPSPYERAPRVTVDARRRVRR